MAIKVVHPGLAADQQFRARFRREVAVSRRVRGPFVASVLDADTEAAEPWLAISYVAGPTLAQRVAEAGPRTQEEVVAIAVALASALRDIHEVGVHHRDLKPANVILGAAGPVVIDFGIAAAADATALTTTGSVMGSAGWMAPEQIRGEGAGAPADVFAWAATVSFAATGRSPFGTGRADAVAYRVAHEAPDLNGVPSVLLGMVERALVKTPGDRPSVPQLLDELRDAVASTDTVVQSRSVEDAVTNLWSAPPTLADPQVGGRRRWQVAAAALLVVALLAASATFLMARRQGVDHEVVSHEVNTTSTAAAMDTTTTTAAATTTAPPTTTMPATTSTTTTTAPTTTATAVPPVPELDGAFDPASDDDVMRIYEFAEGHLQQVVRLNLSWFEGELPTVDADPEWEPGTGIVYLPGTCTEYPFCGGLELLVHDLGVVADADLFYDSGAWVLLGRFVVQSTTVGTGGVLSVSLRAVPVA